MYGWTPYLLRRELTHAEQSDWWPQMVAAAKRHSLDIPYVAAIGSRETNLTNEVGDADNGFGPMQLDRRSHRLVNGRPIERAPVGDLLEACCAYLAQCLHDVAVAFPTFTHDQLMIVAADAYNAGAERAIRRADLGNADAASTGHNYGHDVFARRVWFAGWLK